MSGSVFIQCLLLSNWFARQPYSSTENKANFLSFEILEGPLFIESEENDFANSPNTQISCHLSSLRLVAHSLPCGVVEETINCNLEGLISCLCTVIYHLCDPR